MSSSCLECCERVGTDSSEVKLCEHLCRVATGSFISSIALMFPQSPSPGMGEYGCIDFRSSSPLLQQSCCQQYFLSTCCSALILDVTIGEVKTVSNHYSPAASLLCLYPCMTTPHPCTLSRDFSYKKMLSHVFPGFSVL